MCVHVHVQFFTHSSLHLRSFLNPQANAVGRNSKTVREFLEKNYNDETAVDGVKLACRALLEVVEAGGKNIEVAVLRKGEDLRMLPDDEVEALCTELEAEKAAAEAAKKPAVPQ